MSSRQNQCEEFEDDEGPKSPMPSTSSKDPAISLALALLENVAIPAPPLLPPITENSRLTDVQADDIARLTYAISMVDLAWSATHPAFTERVIKLAEMTQKLLKARRELLLMPIGNPRASKGPGFFEPIDDD